ncbi:MAG: metallophosphoesterase family protein [Acidobacteriota bacterium]
MTSVPRRAVVIWLVCTVLLCGALAANGQTAAGAAIPPPARFGDGNLDRVQRLLAETPGGSAAFDDYYFVAVGDIQNTVRSFSRPVFEAIAKDVEHAVDRSTGKPVYDQVRFVMLLGDLVYEGPVARQWTNLEAMFAGKGLDGIAYPNIARLVRDKPILPAIGNHELLNFRLQTQTKYKDLFDSPVGVANFKRFFAWDRFIANPKILYPVPTDLSVEQYEAVVASNATADATSTMAKHYALGRDGRYRLTFFDQPSLVAEEFAAGKARVAGALAPLFRRAGYGTLPILNSDNMIAYGVDAGNTIFLFLDSMARGWQYPGLAKLKEALYPDKRDQHRLNLFSESPFNGQADFYRAVTAYARETGKSIVPLMHHSVINGSKSIRTTGLGYNLWLALGLPQAKTDRGDPTLFDEILFSDAEYLFSGCVHSFEDFSVVASVAGKPDNRLHWFVAGGGGGPLTRVFRREQFAEIEALYNQKRASIPDSSPAGTIAVVDATARLSHHYLLVHVQHGRIVDVSPRFLDQTQVPRRRARPQVSAQASYYSATSSVGASVEGSPGAWGLERLKGFLAFVNWRPSAGLGVIGDAGRSAGSTDHSAGTVVGVWPLTLDVYIPGSKVVTLRPLGFEMWNSAAGRPQFFVTTGVRVPIVYSGRNRRPYLTAGFNLHIPMRSDARVNAGRSDRVGMSVSIGYRLTR